MTEKNHFLSIRAINQGDLALNINDIFIKIQLCKLFFIIDLYVILP